MDSATPIPHEDPRDPRFRHAPDRAHEDGPGNRAPQPELHESLERGHEVRDAKLRPVLIFIVTLFAAIALIQLGLKYLLRHDVNANLRADEPATLWTQNRPAPPPPHLQPSPPHPELPFTDMQTLANTWHEKLTTPGPSPAGPNFTRIPIDRAIDQAVEHGLPTTQPTGGTP